MNNDEKRREVALVITPYKIWACPMKGCLIFGESLARDIEQIKLRLAGSEYAVPTEYDGGFPKLLIDHWGFSLFLKPYARRITTPERATEVLDEAALASLARIMNHMPEARVNRRGRPNRGGAK